MLAFLGTLLVCLNAQAIGEGFNVMAHPDHRKQHAQPTPQVGGLAILTGFALWVGAHLLMEERNADPLMLAQLLACGGIGLVGFVDDQRDVSPLVRMLLLLLFTGVALALDPQLMASWLNWYSFAPAAVPIWIYLPVIGIAALGMVNSVNMADGQNGLVGGMFVTWSICLMLVAHGTLAAMAGVLLMLSLVFLAFNLAGKMFLGDCGSYGVTFAIGLMVMLAYAQGLVPVETIIVWFFIPMVDCLRLIITRPLQGRSPFAGGRDHFHHRLIDALGSRASAGVYVGVVAASSILATLVPRFSLVILCGLCGFYFSFARLSEGVRAQVAAPDIAQDNEVSAKVLPLGRRRGK